MDLLRENRSGTTIEHVLHAHREQIVESRGRVGVQVRLSGPAGNPEVYGVATVTDGAVRTLALPEPIDDLSGRVTFSQRIVSATATA